MAIPVDFVLLDAWPEIHNSNTSTLFGLSFAQFNRLRLTQSDSAKNWTAQYSEIIQRKRPVFRNIGNFLFNVIQTVLVWAVTLGRNGLAAVVGQFPNRQVVNEVNGPYLPFDTRSAAVICLSHCGHWYSSIKYHTREYYVKKSKQ